MNWKLIGLLAMFGVAMGLGIVFFIPSSVEPVLWLVIFGFSAYVIGKNCTRRRFLHGLLVGLFDSLLKTTTHLVFWSAYLVRHEQEIAMIRKMTTAITPVQIDHSDVSCVGADLRPDHRAAGASGWLADEG